MKLLTYIRVADWWSNKLPTLLAVAYATVLQTPVPLHDAVGYVGLLLFSIIIGAIYVSFINDITDIEVDLANGKRNKMQHVPPVLRWLLLLLCLVVGFFLTIQLGVDPLSLLFYSMSWIVFSLYSLPPIRLKNRGLAGALADAAGAHLFPSLYMVYAICHYAGATPDIGWSVCVGAWAFFHGLRGILWHQYQDRENDIASNLHTFAVHVPPTVFRPIERMILALELTAFAAMLISIGEFVVYMALMVYGASLLLGYFLRGIRPTIVLTPQTGAYQLVFQLFYQSFWPVSLLLVAASQHAQVWWILVIHVFVFPTTLVDIGKNFARWFLSLGILKRRSASA